MQSSSKTDKSSRALQLKDLTAIIDTREQLPLNLKPLKIVNRALKTGDYSLEGYEDLIAVERKTLPDLIQCCTYERERFEREISRLSEFRFGLIVVESSWGMIEEQSYLSRAHPNSIIGSALGFMIDAKANVMMADNHDRAGRLVSRYLWLCAKRLFSS